jgi:acyl-CoA dehydrogenase
MALILFPEAQMVRETVLDFFRERSPVTALRKLRGSNDSAGISRDLWRQMAELGWTGFLVSEDDGGSAFGMTSLAQVMEAAGRTLAATPLLSTALLGASLLSLAGSNDQKAAYLPPLLAGEHIFALALKEGTRHVPDRIALSAERDGRLYGLNGERTFVLDGHIAGMLIMAARRRAVLRCSWSRATAPRARAWRWWQPQRRAHPPRQCCCRP